MQPFAGKTRLLRAIEWYAFQCNWADFVGKTAYTWRAAKQLDTAIGTGVSTCQLL